MDRDELEGLDRESLVRRAEVAGIRRARILTRPELIDELLRLDPRMDEMQLKRSRGFFGRARDLLSRVVERGLHLPDAATRIRWTGTLPPAVPQSETQALPTLTLAEIYAAQGHKQRAIETLRRVLEREPEHGSAQALLASLEDVAYVAPAPPLPPEPEVEPEPAPPPEEEEEEELEVADAESPGDVYEEEETEATLSAEGAPPPIEVREVGEIIEEPAGEPAVASESAPAIESDDCVALPLAKGAIYVWWRVSRRTVDALAESSSARFTLRAVVVEPSWDGPVTTIHDREVGVDAGEAILADLPVAAVVRVAVGILEAATFVPIAHSPALETESDDDEGATRLVRWTVEGSVPVALDDPEAPVSRALAGARRAARAARGARA
ncbi:tetratricopeptide repeat protein [Labilithrix luteola]|nr:tetratricopeptide repeat protein [Labilithrix luteola]